MGLFNKIKGIFIEDVPEGDEEEEEEIKVAKKIENKDEVPSRRERDHKETLNLNMVFNKPVQEPKEEEHISETKEFDKPPINEFKFPFSDDDFKVEDEKKEIKEEPKLEIKEEPKKEENYTIYHKSASVTLSDNAKETEYHEVYENNGTREEKHVFQRSPIISPVWGILDKNYKKEEIVSRKEIRLTTNNRKADLDAVREKAYGYNEIVNDIDNSIKENNSEMENEKKVEDKNLLYDLSENESPNVKTVTMGDAEEYYNDLGLEYNVDYTVDNKPAEKKKEEELVRDNLESNNKIEPVEENNIEENNDEEDDDNLFDLIDSMYEGKE